MTLLQGGLRCCPKCGFEGDTPKGGPEESRRRSPTLFWILLVTPAFLALLSFLVGRTSDKTRGLGMAIGLIALPIGLASSLYCSIWLARRFGPSGSLNLLMVFFLLFVLAAVNFVIIGAGCAPNFTID